MANFNTTKIAANALKLIRMFGEPSSVTSFPAPPANPTEPWNPSAPQGVTQVGVSVVYLPQMGINREQVVYADGTAQRVGDLKLLVGNDLKQAPDVGAIFTRGDGSKWKVKNVAPIAPSGVVLVYELWATQG